MPEANGYQNPRMDRIERSLELLIADHEQFRAEHKQLLIAQVVQQDEIDKLLAITKEHTRQIEADRDQMLALREAQRDGQSALDKRVNDLVSAIADLIARIPPQNLSR